VCFKDCYGHLELDKPFQKTNFVRSSVGISAIVVFGYIFSFVQSAVFASLFGLTYEADAYVIAAQIPLILFAVIAVGVRTVILPIYTKRLMENGESHANLFVRNILTIALLLASIFALIGIILAEPIVFLFAPGFDTQTHNLTVKILKIIFPIIIFTIQSDIYNAILNTRRVFFWPQMASYIKNLSQILVLLVFASQFGIYGAAIGLLSGTILQSIYLVLLASKHFVYRPFLDIHDPDVHKVGKLILPVTIGISIAQIKSFIERNIASGLNIGSIAALNYASNINSIFSGLFVQAISTVIYPSFAEHVINKDFTSLNRLINSVISGITLIILPIMGGLIICNKELVAILLERGFFDSNATSLTGSILIFYNIGLIFVIIRDIISRVFYSFNDTKTPMFNSSIGLIIQVLLSIPLSKVMGAPGLALASSISSAIICLQLIINLKNKYDVYNLTKTINVLKKSSLATICMVGILYIYGWINPIKNPIIVLLSYGVFGSVIYVVLLISMRTKEILLLRIEVRKIILTAGKKIFLLLGI
jgi:putative peptidoglycan lipid II flippase